MATDGDRTRYWPAIETKYGQPMQYWFDQVADVSGGRYGDQIARLREGFGFSQAHANAVVMYVRGSASSKRFDTLDGYLEGVDPVAVTTVRGVFDALRKACPGSDVVIAWNQPMLKVEQGYVFGVSLASRHMLLAPWGAGVLEQFTPRLQADGYVVNKKTIRVPLDWPVDAALLGDMAAARLAELGTV